MEIEIIRGDDMTLTFNITRDNAVMDITGCTCFLTVKKRENETDDDAIISKTWNTHKDPINGQTEVTISSNDTTGKEAGVYYWDLQVKDTSGKINSIEANKFTILADITKRVII